LLRLLYQRKYTGHKAIFLVLNFLSSANLSVEEKQLVYDILDKDLRCGISVATINTVFPGLIPEFNVALGKIYSSKKQLQHSKVWYGSRKLDGVRLLLVKQGTAVSCISRTGKQFITLKRLEKLARRVDFNFVLDGELCIVNKDGNEDFKAVTKIISRKNFQARNFKFIVFDSLSVTEFESEGKQDSIILHERLERAQEIVDKINSKKVVILPQTRLVTDVSVEDWLDDQEEIVRKKGWEGTILRADALYKAGRSNHILKIKPFREAEYKILEVQTGPYRVKEKGKEKVIQCMTTVKIKHKGCDVWVGSGWSLKERKKYFLYPEKLVGRIMTVKYFQETKNDRGEVSLRFPTKKIIHPKNGRKF
jgi:DNA ligase-1